MCGFHTYPHSPINQKYTYYFFCFLADVFWVIDTFSISHFIQSFEKKKTAPVLLNGAITEQQFAHNQNLQSTDRESLPLQAGFISLRSEIFHVQESKDLKRESIHHVTSTLDSKCRIKKLEIQSISNPFAAVQMKCGQSFAVFGKMNQRVIRNVCAKAQLQIT